MSETTPRPRVQMDLSAQEFKTVIRALTGDLNRTGTKLEEEADARELGIRILDQYVRCEKTRLQHLGAVLDHLRKPEGDVPEVVHVGPPEPEVTILRPRSGLASAAGAGLVQRREPQR
jgi:hypothetical protein